ncbi:hypothetical protein RI129_013036 [Pyrocoelia pectoralis]|uniref:Uncharacterized protein n=1 Tax=Pyrocoelia pectoralis TaxID=417401 RepID=A0AAN7V446_9COLE
MQPQYSQGTAPSHHPPPYPPPEVSGNGGSVTSSLRQWRKKDYLEKKSTEENSPPVNENPSHIARVAPHTYYPRPPDDQCNYQHQYGDYSLSYKPAAPVKYSEIVENQQATQTIENITPVIQKHKEKEYVELCSVAPQSHLKQFQDHIPMKQSTYMEPPFTHQYIPKDSQIHSFLQKQSQMPQYIQKEPYQQFLSKFNMQNQYPPPYSSEPNNFLAHLNKINPRMAQSIINDTHLRESQVPVYHNLDHSRSYPQPQRMYHPSSMPSNPAHPPRNLPPSYNYSQSYNYNVKPNIPPGDPYNRPYQHNMSKYLPEQSLPNISPQHLYNESMHMNYGPYPPKLSPNYSHLEYAQHYQHRRQFPQEYYTHPSYKDSFAHNPQLSPEDLVSDSAAGPRKPSLKQYLETWVEENISGNLPEMVTPSALADMENLQHLKTALQAKTGETQDQPLYVLDTTEITNDNLPQFLHLQQFEKLPENIRGYYHSTNATSLEARQVIIENKKTEIFPNDSCSSLLAKPLSEKCSMVATVETERVTERAENSEKSLENKVVEIHILEDSEAAEISDGSPLMLNPQRSEHDDSVIKMCTRLQEDDSNHSRDSLKSMPDIDCNGQTVNDAVRGSSPCPQLNLDRETNEYCEGQSVDEPVDLVMSNTNSSVNIETLRNEPEDGTTSNNPVVVQAHEISKEINVDESVTEVSNVEELTEPSDINREIQDYENPGTDVSSLDKFLEEIGFEGNTSPKDQMESSEPEILNNTQQLDCQTEEEEKQNSDNKECAEELKDSSIPEDIPPIPQVEVTHSVSEQSMPENQDIPPVPQTHTVSEQSTPENEDIPPVAQVEVTHSVSEQSTPENEDIPPVPQVEVTRSISEQSMPESKDVSLVPQVEVTHSVSEQSMPENEDIPTVPQVEVTHNVSEQPMAESKDMPHVKESAKTKNVVNMKHGRKRDRKKDLYKKEKMRKKKKVEREPDPRESVDELCPAVHEREPNEEICGEEILKEVECVDLPDVTVSEDIPEAMEENSEEMPVLEKATFDETETNIVYHINDSNVILQIADELLEINITTQNGKKLILVKTFSDAVIMNNNEENCPILEDQTVVQPKSVPPVEHPVMDNYTNVTVDNVEMYVKEICEGPDIPIENEVCVFNEEVVSSSTEVESVPEQPPPPECTTEEKKVTKKKSAKKKTVTWLDQTVPENGPKRCLDTKTPSPKTPKTKAALKLIEPHNSKINKDHCVPSKTTKNNTIADKISKLKKPRIDNKLKHQKVNKPKKSESHHHPKNIPKTKERVIKHTTTTRKSDTFGHSRKSKFFCKTPVNIDSLYRMSIEPENLAKIKKGLETTTKPKSEKVVEVKLPTPEEPRLPLISVQENSITSSTCQDTEATQRERANKLIQQINDDWEDEDDNNKTVENNIRRLSLQEYNNRKRTGSITESDDKKYNVENPDLTSNLLGNIRRRTPPKSPELSVKFINKTYSRTSSLERTNESSPSRKGEESLSSSIELQLPKRSRVLPTPNYNQEYLKKALMNDLQTVNQITTTLIKENQELMHRFLEQQRLTVTELKKVKQIIRYKRLVQHLTTMKVKETEPNNNVVVRSPINPSRTYDNNNLKKNILEKRRKKRFRFLYSDDDFEEDLRNSSPIIVNETCLKRSCVVDNLVPDYSVHQRNSQGQLTLVFKRNVKSDPRMQPFVKLERLPSLDRLALQL